LKNYFKLLSHTLLILLFVSGCSNDAIDSNDADNVDDTITAPTPKISSKYYGKWIYVHSGEEIDILTSTDLVVTQVDDDRNLLTVTKNGVTYYLARASLANTTANGRIEAVVSTTSAPSRISGYAGIGNINIVLSNVIDAKIKEATTTRDDGSFVTTTLPTGTYDLQADNITFVVELKNEINEIGTYKLTGSDLNNFKAELIVTEDFIYADTYTYEAILRVHNISDKVGYGLNYDINMSGGAHDSFTEGSLDALGSVQARSYKDIPLSFSFS